MIRATLVTVLLAVVVVLGARMVNLRPQKPQPEQLVATPEDSDYYLLDAVVRQMDDSGKPEYRMSAAQTLHYPDKSTRLTDIHVNYFGQTQSLWELDAKRGRIPPGKRDILLHDGVEARRIHEGEEAMRLRTEHAWVRPDQDQVDTDATVHATAPGQQATGLGMIIFIKQNRVVLAKNVQVTFKP